MKKSLLVGLLMLASCGSDSPPVPTAEQDQQLNEAERLLDEADRSEPATGDSEAS